jgi:hypothetical protein
MRVRIAPSSCLLAIATIAFANPASAKDQYQTAWLPIAGETYSETKDPELRDIGEADPDALLSGEYASFRVLGKTVVAGKSAKEWQIEDQAEEVGATLVLYWIAKGESEEATLEYQRSLSSGAGPNGSTVSTFTRDGSYTGAMKVTTGEVHALYLRDCTTAPCAGTQDRSELGSLRTCWRAGCLKEIPIRQRSFVSMAKVELQPTEAVEMRRIEPTELGAFAAENPDLKVVGKSVVFHLSGDQAAMVEQGRRVGATMVVWWLAPDAAGGLPREHAVYLRDCSAAPCTATP